MNIQLGDIYIRNSDSSVYIVKKIDNNMIVLESEKGHRLALTEVFGLEKKYTKKDGNQ